MDCIKICEDCGFVVEDNIDECPVCKGNLREGGRCKQCGCVEPAEIIKENGGVCDECINEVIGDVGACVRLGDEEKTNVAINGFLAQVFSPSLIDKMLTAYLEGYVAKFGITDGLKKDMREYVLFDKSWSGNCIIDSDIVNQRHIRNDAYIILYLKSELVVGNDYIDGAGDTYTYVGWDDNTDKGVFEFKCDFYGITETKQRYELFIKDFLFFEKRGKINA